MIKLNKNWKETIKRMLIAFFVINIGIIFNYIIWSNTQWIIVFIFITQIILNIIVIISGILGKYLND
ncbi:hypothetical protein LCGC14_0560170 [marine sediment metagenome]|uniref:Uncharacterized protein n=1 Tax=marine sediment metagenome TaxID=412755 RepID=A0A0F9RM46_9ZZZZ